MTISNREIAQTFDAVADLLEIKGESFHRVNAYRNAAQTIAELPRDLSAIAADSDLTTLPNIGKTLAEKITEMLNTGELDFYKRLVAEVPPSLIEVRHINGVGPKKAALFWKSLGITSVQELQAAAQEGKLRDLKGMGEKSEQRILEGIAAIARRTGRIRLDQALPVALEILADLLALPQAQKGDVAGSLRRFRPTIGDIDLLIASDDPQPIMEAFVNRPGVARILGHGEKKSSVELFRGQQVDLRILPPERYGTALSYFTGSQAHNIRLRELALKRGLSLNEHDFSPLDGTGDPILCATEEEVYAALGLPWIPPEMREDQGEIEAAQRGELPRLISMEDIRADLHMHTTWSDGKLSIQEMAEVARGRGLAYIVITDHSPTLGVANGLSPERLLEQQAEVRRVNALMGPDFTVLHGTEMDINADGSLDYPDEVLAQLDVVVASLHMGLRQPREQVTERLLTAIRNPHVDIIGHPRGQLIERREAADLDMDLILAAALQHDVALEINANPYRLDLEAPLARRAAGMGIKIAINTDAHSASDFEVLRYGVGTARRAWLSAPQVINTWQLDTFLQWVQARG